MQSLPFNLRCDLIAHPEYVSSRGFSTNIPLSEIDQYPTPVELVIINNRQPALSWNLPSGTRQQAFQLIVSDQPELLLQGKGNYWDSGKVFSEQPMIVYAGPRLRARKVYHWTVRVWDDEGQMSGYATPQSFMTGALSRKYTPAYYPIQKKLQFPQYIQSVSDDHYFVDFRQAAFGTLQLTLKSDAEGREITVHLGEVLKKPKQIHREPGGGRRYRAIPLRLQKGTHTYQLQLTPDRKNTRKHAVKMPEYIGEVMPFRYVEITSYPHELDKLQLQRITVHYPFQEDAAHFRSSSEVLNQVWDLCKYTIKATSFAGIYVDGDRERVCYESDSYINQLSHYGVDAEYSLARRTLEYLMHYATWPTEWILHGVLVAYADWMYTGDTQMIERYYPLLKNRTLVSLADEQGLISSSRSRRRTERSVNYDRTSFKRKPLKDIVDWPQTGGMGLSEDDPGETDGFEFCELNIVVNAFHYYALRLMAEMAQAIGKEKEHQFWKERQAKVYRAFQQHFFDAERQIYVDGVGSQHASLHANMFPLAFGLVPTEQQPSVVAFVKTRGMACSVYGAQYLLEGLYEANEAEYALQLLTSTEERSWHSMLAAGSTMTMEAWGDRFKPNQDWNHAWGAAPANIIPRYLVGVRPLTAGFFKVLIQPQPGLLIEFEAKVPSIRGPFMVHYQREDTSYKLQLQVPGNVEALVRLPCLDLSGNIQIHQNGQKVSVKLLDGFYEIPSVLTGEYTFVVASTQGDES
uniref:alpha-L-rhamnosidase n=1 Tax=Roseihalotalea indica TaxID=2867963 RepID=A0AA49GR33_9BACT|nr:family 78 glycoside hydrolase catalytic domain [Tunicatimonas sp. TK19036]